MKFIETVFEHLKRHPKRIVFPEGTEPRVLEAAVRYARMKLGPPILLGKKDEILLTAEKHGFDVGWKNSNATATSAKATHGRSC